MASVITGFIFNENAFNALAIEVPKTQDDFYAALDKLKEDGTFIPLAMGGTGDYAHLSNSEKGFMNVGPNYWNGEEGRLALLDGSQKLTDEQWVEPWRQVLQWMPYAGDNGMNLTQEEAMDLFMSGAAAVYPVGSWELQVLEEGVNGAFPMGVFKPPVPVEGDQCYIQDHIDMAMAINAASPHKEAAQTFLEWVGSEEFNILYANALPGFFPLSNFKVSVDNKLQNDMISWRDDCESSIRPFSQFLDRHDPTTTTQSFTASAEVTNGVKSPEDVAAEMQVVLESWYEPQMETNSGTSSAITIIAVAHKVFTATFVIAIFAALLE
jgi:raffinose/stachyose/melibiose transport system substrate-binding protein